MKEELPKGVHIGCMKFGKFEWSSQKGKEYQLISLEVLDDYGGMVTELRGFSRETNQTLAVEFEADEKIVAAKVRCHTWLTI
jgi:hypothetical protein